MYCSHCGSQASGNYCAGCGTALNASIAAVPTANETSPSDWSQISDGGRLLQIPEVRELIADYATRSTAKMSAEQFLGVADKLLAPLTAGLPLSPLAKVGQSMYANMGVKTGKSREEFLPTPIGHVIVRALCSFAERGQQLLAAKPAADGCLLEATLPSDVWSFEGKLVVTISQQHQGTYVESLTDIPGQLFDWGKSKRCLDTLFVDLQELARAA